MRNQTAPKNSPASDLAVNEHEGLVLSLMARSPSATRYQIFEAMRASPLSSLNTSKGSFYPLVTRLIERGYVKAATRTAGREAEELNLTTRGRQALAQWMFLGNAQQSFTHDPMLHRILTLADLSHAERLDWIASARAMLIDKKRELDAYLAAVPDDYAAIVHGTSLAIVRAKLKWLDRLHNQVSAETE